jgi:hypothetical protein
MNHTYLIFANHKERIEKLVELIHGLNGFGTAKFEDMVQVSTEDDDLAGILDRLLGPYEVGTKPADVTPPAPPKNKRTPTNGGKRPAWYIKATGECVTQRELKHKLAVGELSEGDQVLQDPGGDYVVALHLGKLSLEKVK